MTQINRDIPPQVHNVTDICLPQLTTQTLDNGLTLHILDRPDMDVMRLSIVWPDGKSTAAAAIALPVMASLLTEGAGGYDAERVNDILDFNGAWFSCMPDTHYTVATLAAPCGNARQVIPLLADMIVRPRFDEASFTPIRDRLAAEAAIELRQVLAHATCTSARQIFGADHPVSRLTTPDDIRRLTRGDITDAHRRLMLNQRPTLYMAGHITDEIIETVRDTLGHIPAGTAPEPEIPAFNPADDHNPAFTHIPDTMQAAIVMAMPTIGRDHPDYIPLRLTVMALGGYFGARLMSNIREDKGYTYGITAALMGFREGGVVSIKTQTDCSYVEPLIQEIRREIERLATEPPEGAELETLQRTAMSQLLMSVDDAFHILDYHIQHLTLRTPADYIERQIAAINTLTPQIIAATARRYILPNRFYTSIATK